MWRSIAGPEMRSESWGVIEEIEVCLAELLARPTAESWPELDVSLASGDAGMALFFAYLGAARSGSAAADHALRAVGRSLDALAGQRLPPTLYTGFCGIGWVVEHLVQSFFEAGEDLSGEIDEALLAILSKVSEPTPYELIGGLAGCGTYLLERSGRPTAQKALGVVLDLLETSSEESDDGVTWFTPPEWLSNEQRERMPEGTYNLGLAHGVAGVVGFLAAVRRAGAAEGPVARLAEGAVRWLLAHRRPREEDWTVSAFPSFYVPGREPEAARTAWCYGDLGTAAALLAAARAFCRVDWETEALALARLAARRSVEATQAVDSGLCHGMAGLAHLFNRLYQATGDAELEEAARSWFRWLLDRRRPGEGLAGLLSWISQEAGAGSWRSEPGFLVGVSGVGLALLAAVSEVEPAWDRVMLISVPPLAQPAGETGEAGAP